MVIRSLCTALVSRMSLGLVYVFQYIKYIYYLSNITLAIGLKWDT